MAISRTTEARQGKIADRETRANQSRADVHRRAVRNRRGLNSRVAVLTAGRDRHYALGLAFALIDAGIRFDYVGSQLVDSPELHATPLVRVLSLREQQPGAGLVAKVVRIIRYYARLMRYAVTTDAAVFHILWNNKIELFDRTLLMLYYKALGKKLVFTAHNVNAGTRDDSDSAWNRLTLRAQYHLLDHIFVHTSTMKRELHLEFGVKPEKVTVIPYGINNAIPQTSLSCGEAKKRLGLKQDDKAILFYGNIAPYKGLEYLISTFSQLSTDDPSYRLIIAGNPKWSADYWLKIAEMIKQSGLEDRIMRRIEHIPDVDTELYFKAADVLVLPYTVIFQSGVLILSFSLGLPVIATNVGELKQQVEQADAGLSCETCSSVALANAIRRYFGSDLFLNLEYHRDRIRKYANEQYSWTKVVELTSEVYARLLGHCENHSRDGRTVVVR